MNPQWWWKRNRHIYIYQESDVVTGVDDAKLWVFVGGNIRWSWTNCTRPHDDDDECEGVDGITCEWWFGGKNGVDGDRTYVDDDFVWNGCCCCCCWEESILWLFIIDDGGGVGGVDISIISWGVDIELVKSNDGDGDGGCGSTNVRNAWSTRRVEHEYEWSSSMEIDGRCLPPAFNDGLALSTW